VLSLNIKLLEEHLETTSGLVRAIAAAQLETGAQVRTLARHVADVTDTINRLGHVAPDRDERFRRLESN